ncbi:hypothetical protein BGZ96_003803, partial [Linnemannia gamsii]
MSFTPPNTQAIRSININNLTPPPPEPAEIVYVDICTDPITKERFILWEDIRLVFYNALHIRHKARVVPFMKGSDFNTLKPFRIAVIPGEVLDIIVGNPQETTHQQQQQQQSSGLRQIEQQAALLPRHNPLATLQPHSPTHPSSSILNSRFGRRTGDNVGNPLNSNLKRLQPNDAAVRARNKELAHKYAKEAMAKVASAMDLNTLHIEGDGAPGDFMTALQCYLKAVNKGHADALVNVGDLFLEGQGVSKDSSVAMGWYLKSAYQGNKNAQRKVEALRLSEHRKTTTAGHQLNSNNNPPGTQPSSDNNQLHTAKQVTSSADSSLQTKLSQSEINAQVALGEKYKDGLGVQRDYRAAIECYLKAASQGDASSQFKLGVLYHMGQGVKQNHSIAMDWYLKAASQGNANAEFAIGLLHDKGQGVSQDYSQAMEWYLKAANQGDADAQYNIGDLYYFSRGVSQDYSQAME